MARDLIGTGWSTATGLGYVSVTAVVPTSGDDVTVTAHEDNAGSPFVWSVTAYAICAAGILDVSIEDDYKGSYSSTHGGSITCDSGDVSLGAGFRVENYPQYTVLGSLLPGGTYSGLWLVNATVYENDTGTTSPWGLTMFQICAEA